MVHVPNKPLNLYGFGHLKGGQASLEVIYAVSLKTIGDYGKHRIANHVSVPRSMTNKYTEDRDVNQLLLI